MRALLILFNAVGIAAGTHPLVASDDAPQKPASGAISDVVLISEVKWEKLNPARGDKSPKAATLWGDRKGTVPTGFLVKFVDGFSSPPHIHNVTYRGVVISGLIHNDDPGAAEMWMPTGSFWTQPKGEVHITAAKGDSNVAFIEIDRGPYLVLPSEEAFDKGERPVNLVPSNIVWLDASDLTWIEGGGVSASTDGPGVALLWGNTEEGRVNGSFVRLPAGFSGKILSRGATFRAVVIEGQAAYEVPGGNGLKTLEPGSYFSSEGKAEHPVSSAEGEMTLLYVRTDGGYSVLPAKTGQ